jgi:hypothetical protein
LVNARSCARSEYFLILPISINYYNNNYGFPQAGKN